MAEHHHDHHHVPELSRITRAFKAGIILNSLFIIIEFAAGIYYNSLALLSDAGHNLSDVASLGLSLFAFKMSESRATSRFTYGYHKSTILASLVNAVILLVAVGSIGWEAIERFRYPVETDGGVVAKVATIGIVINAASAFFFFRSRDKDLNTKGAFLHLATDALVSAGVVVAGIVMAITGIKWIDPLISLVIMAIVIIGTWSLLKESLRLSLDAVPDKIDIEKIRTEVLKTDGIKDIHHIHIWAMSTTKNAMTAHLIIDDSLEEKGIAMIKSKLRHRLEHLNIHHATFETETEICNDEDC